MSGMSPQTCSGTTNLKTDRRNLSESARVYDSTSCRKMVGEWYLLMISESLFWN